MKSINLKLSALIMAVALTFCACSDNSKAIDGEKLASDIVETVAFKDTLEQVPTEIAEKIYEFDQSNVKSISTYMGSGATAEEVTVVQFNKMTNSDKEAFESRIDNQIKSYETYMPNEIDRIKKNVIIYSNDTAILCISDDSDAESKINELIK